MKGIFSKKELQVVQKLFLNKKLVFYIVKTTVLNYQTKKLTYTIFWRLYPF